MFKFLEDSVENTLDVVTDSWDGLTGEGDGPKKRQIAKLIADGMTVAAVAGLYGVGTDVIEAWLDD